MFEGLSKDVNRVNKKCNYTLTLMPLGIDSGESLFNKLQFDRIVVSED